MTKPSKNLYVLVVIVAGRDDARVLLAGGGHYARQDNAVVINGFSVRPCTQ